MIGLLRRLFRRTPPHLRGRVPVDCGEGQIGPPAWIEPGRICVKHEWGTEPDEAGRAFLRSVPPLKMPPEPRQTAPDALVSWEEWRAHVRLIETEMLGSKQPPPEPPRYVRRELGNGWVTHTIKILERPSPAENARRYTDEDGTW